jgi:hypothetical protein
MNRTARLQISAQSRSTSMHRAIILMSCSCKHDDAQSSHAVTHSLQASIQLSFCFITFLFLFCLFFFLFLRTTGSQIHFWLRPPGSCARMLPTTAARLTLGLSTGGRGQKLLPTVVAAKVERLSSAFGVESRGFVHGHSADGVFGHGFRFFHCFVSFLVVVIAL